MCFFKILPGRFMWQRFSLWLLSKSLFVGFFIVFGDHSSTAWGHGKGWMFLAALVVSFHNGFGKRGANRPSLGPTAVDRQIFKDHLDRQCNIWGWLKWVVELLSLKEAGGGWGSGWACWLAQPVAMQFQFTTWSFSKTEEWEWCWISSCLRNQDFPATCTSAQKLEST